MPSRREARVTLAAVAEDAGVSLSTASVVLSGNSRVRKFTQSTILRVQASAQRLSYRPSLIASGLPSKGSSLFFLVALHDLHRGTHSERLLWGFDAELLGGITEASQQERIYPIITLTRTHTAELDGGTLDSVIRGGAFGAIVRTPSPLLEKQIRIYLRESLAVLVLFPSVLAEWPTNAVDVDNLAMGRLAGELFAAQGRTRWMIILDEKSDAHNQRLRGFRSAAREGRASVEMVKCPSLLNARDTSALLAVALTRIMPDAVFALTAQTAQSTLHACRATGLRHAGADELGEGVLRPGGVGGTRTGSASDSEEEILLIGCDCSVWHRPLMPMITSLEACWREAGDRSLRILLKMRDEGKSRHPRVLLDPIVIPGDTCPSDPAVSGASSVETHISS